MKEWLLPLIVGFVISFILTPVLITYFRSKKEGQMIREEGPKWHEKKSGTPTMGGLAFIISVIITTLICTFILKTQNLTTVLLILLILSYGLIGMWDDSIKIFKRQNEGFKASQKFSLQVLIAIVFGFIFIVSGQSTVISIFGHNLFDLGYLYIIFVVLWITGFSNAVNLTDGLDGLVTGLSIISFFTYGIIAYVQHQYNVLIFCLSIVGSLIAFLLYNRKPAKIFMGDMGSLALGASLAGVSIILKQELSLIWIGLVFVIETLSVMLQVGYFKLTKKRIFKMTPIHHHFEMSGWSEWKVVTVFWFVGLITSISYLLLYR
ncbi:phospho-N-acetylmuramoyl-pentapeptide-transferase [Lactobacillus sp. S2-2]|uniref:phospho-N-acetylmuramoyl-pentapeptide- transferase n=1 Tax=Lactobacillus sp. S2-2 TaxID=2692917 RepID=UPI001EFFD4C6|nr:phospho-N-acetylmuramoyl-pentapeptide-transferase [Lactobacillus sp. S2-2]